MISPFASVVVRTTCQVIIPYMQVFALYTLFHGHYSPGGGFQAGAILGASVILARLTQRPHLGGRFFAADLGLRAGGFGVLIYGLMGMLPLLWGAELFNYGHIRLFSEIPAKARYYGILGIEIGVMLAVAGIMVSIFDDLAATHTDEEST